VIKYGLLLIGGLVMNEVLKAIKERRSIRAYETKQISQEELALIIEAGIYAPTGHNFQPWHFTVIQNREVIEEINKAAKHVMATLEIEWIKKMGLNPEFDISYKAPTLIIVSGKKDGVSSRADCDAATENILLAAQSLNIGSVWVGFAFFAFMVEGMAQKIGIPEGYEPYHGITLGYKKADINVSVPKRNYDVVSYIR
jgi:nitroreductase